MAPPTMAPPISPAATPAATPRCAWAGVGAATAATANPATATTAIKLFFMTFTFLSTPSLPEASGENLTF
jgi:hypothetical protein